MNSKKEVVYNNDLNTIIFRDFNALDFDYLMMICTRLRLEGYDKKVVFYFYEIKKILKIEYMENIEIVSLLESLNRKLLSINGTIKRKKISQFVLFTGFDIDPEEFTLEVKVNPDYYYILKDIDKNFTVFEFEEFIRLKSKYAKTLYRLLKQYRDTGKYVVKINDLKLLMIYNTDMETKYFVRDMISKAITELNKRGYFKDLHYETILSRRDGKTIDAVCFLFDPQQRERKEDPQETPQENRTAPRASAKKNRFNNFQQRDFNYDDIEAVMSSS